MLRALLSLFSGATHEGERSSAYSRSWAAAGTSAFPSAAPSSPSSSPSSLEAPLLSEQEAISTSESADDADDDVKSKDDTPAGWDTQAAACVRGEAQERVVDGEAVVVHHAQVNRDGGGQTRRGLRT